MTRLRRRTAGGGGSSRFYTARDAVCRGRDPQQLPGTSLSGAAQGVSFQDAAADSAETIRRARRGGDVTLGAVPHAPRRVAAFPSWRFQHDRLVDSRDSVVTAAAPRPRRAPTRTISAYVVFDASGGARATTPLADCPTAAAAAAAGVPVQERRADRGARRRRSRRRRRVAVIRPYREQRALILRAFAVLCGGEGAAARLGVSVSTVDRGYRAKRSGRGHRVHRSGAGGRRRGGGIPRGRATHERRLTRAKRALWVVGRPWTRSGGVPCGRG